MSLPYLSGYDPEPPNVGMVWVVIAMVVVFWLILFLA